MIEFKINKYYISFGGLRRKVWFLWIPDGLHIWKGCKGIHIFWSGGPPHITHEICKRHEL